MSIECHDGIGDKVGSALQSFAACIAGLVLGCNNGVTRIEAFATAGAVAEDVFSSIRTVFSYNEAAYESNR
ncbi:unnamed protein product [Rotaria magnacalcarata]|nr:unnamed protein product [Rotaria magnacalcarata]